MPSIPRPRRPLAGRRSSGRARKVEPPRIVVLGDLALDVVVTSVRPPERGTDVPGRVSLVQGGSAANAARWLARLGARTTLITAVGRDPMGRALVDAVRADGVTVRAVRVTAARSARIAVLVTPDGERSFVTDRGAAEQLAPTDLRADWFDGIRALHLPAYSLLGPVGKAGRQAIALARGSGASVSVDLASIGPLLAEGRRAAHELVAAAAPDVVFATAAEADALLGGGSPAGLLEVTAVAVVKRGSKGATVLAREGDQRLRFEVATTPITAADTTGAGDAFDAGFLVGWFSALAAGRALPDALHRATVGGHRAAARQLSMSRPELPLR